MKFTKNKTIGMHAGYPRTLDQACKNHDIQGIWNQFQKFVNQKVSTKFASSLFEAEYSKMHAQKRFWCGHYSSHEKFQESDQVFQETQFKLSQLVFYFISFWKVDTTQYILALKNLQR